MAIFDAEIPRAEVLPGNFDQYTISDSDLLKLTTDLITTTEPFIYEGAEFGEDVISGMSNDSAIYLVDGESQYANIARTLEAKVEETDKNWRQNPIMTAKYHEPIEAGSEFLIFVNGVSTDLPKAVGSMRIMSLNDDITGAAKHNFNIAGFGVDAPERLDRLYEDEVVLDVADIVVRPEYRLSNLNVSAWLNHALNRISGERNVDRLVSCMNDQEAKLLKLQGINFSQIGEYAAEYDDDGTLYRFYDVEFKSLLDELTITAEALYRQKGVQKAIGSRALIAVRGTKADLSRE